MYNNKKIASTALIFTFCALLISSVIPTISGSPGSSRDFETDNLSGNITYLVDDNQVDTIKAGQDFSVRVFAVNEENSALNDVNLELFSKTKLDSKTIGSLSSGENKTKVLSGRAGEAGTKIIVKINGESVDEQEVKSVGQAPSEGGFSLTLLLAAAAALFVVGIVLGYKMFGGRGGGGPPVYTTPTKRSSSESANARGGATKALQHADSLLSEARDAGADVSTEEELMRTASTFHERAEEEHSDDRFDSAYAYAEGASILGQSISSSIEKKRKAAEEGESDIADAEDAIKNVRKNMKEAKDKGVDVGPSTSLSELASKIIKSAPKAEDPEVYSFQAETARRIAEHANESLESSISGQEDQIKRTEERIDDADEALEGVGELIEKRRDEFDTLMPEYWHKIAEEVRSVADDKDLNAEVREAMADTTIRICEWIEGMFERRDLRSRMKEEGGGGIIRR